jgi:hypothetical protein
MRLILTLAGTALLLASLWIATTNGRRPNSPKPQRRFDERNIRGWALVYLLLAFSFLLLAWFWPELTSG